MEITAQELHSMAAAVDEAHHEAMRTFAEETAARHADLTRGDGRRSFMKKAGLSGAVLAAAPLMLPGWAGVASADDAADAQIAVYAQSVELAAVDAYTAAAAALSDAVKPVALMFMQHHKDHADAFAAVALALGGQPTNRSNQALVAAAQPVLAAVKTEADALGVAETLENQAAATYAYALTVLQNPDAVAGTATILPIESEHAVILSAALGKAPAAMFPTGPFESTAVGALGDPTKGLDPSKYPVA